MDFVVLVGNKNSSLPVNVDNIENVYKVKEVFIHPDVYIDKETRKNDIAIVSVDKPIQMKEGSIEKVVFSKSDESIPTLPSKTFLKNFNSVMIFSFFK